MVNFYVANARHRTRLAQRNSSRVQANAFSTPSAKPSIPAFKQKRSARPLVVTIGLRHRSAAMAVQVEAYMLFDTHSRPFRYPILVGCCDGKTCDCQDHLPNTEMRAARLPMCPHFGRERWEPELVAPLESLEASRPICPINPPSSQTSWLAAMRNANVEIISGNQVLVASPASMR